MERNDEPTTTRDSRPRMRSSAQGVWFACGLAVAFLSAWWLRGASDGLASPVVESNVREAVSTVVPDLATASVGEPEAEPLVRIEVAADPHDSGAPSPTKIRPVGSLAGLDDAQKQTVMARLVNFAAGNRDEAARIDRTKPEKELEWLTAMRHAALKDAAVEVVRRGDGWAFLAEDSELRHEARRLVPREWQSVILGNGAQTAGGRAIDLLIPIDPGEFPVPYAQDARIRTLVFVRDLNNMADDKRRELIEQHLAAQRAGTNEANTFRLPPGVEIDFTTWTVRAR